MSARERKRFLKQPALVGHVSPPAASCSLPLLCQHTSLPFILRLRVRPYSRRPRAHNRMGYFQPAYFDASCPHGRRAAYAASRPITTGKSIKYAAWRRISPSMPRQLVAASPRASMRTSCTAGRQPHYDGGGDFGDLQQSARQTLSAQVCRRRDDDFHAG